MRLDTLQDALEFELADLYSGETQIIENLPKMIAAISCVDTRKALQDHLGETKNQLKRLDEIFGILGKRPAPETCEAMQGLMTEAAEVISTPGNALVKDAVLIGAAQRVEHYEMAGYGTARAFADKLGLDDISDLLQATLDEEGAANEKLISLATGGYFTAGVNDSAKRGARA